jgi:Meckelin (Transmembrane protein 67)
MICDMNTEEVERVYKIGNTVESKCQFDLSQLISDKKLNKFNQANYFYEVFLVDTDGSLIDIPVLVTNMMTSSGTQPNQQEDASKWLLTRRFYLFDTISAVRENEYPSGVPTSIQYASNIELLVNLDNINEEKLYVPLLKVTYRSRAVSII